MIGGWTMWKLWYSAFWTDVEILRFSHYFLWYKNNSSTPIKLRGILAKSKICQFCTHFVQSCMFNLVSEALIFATTNPTDCLLNFKFNTWKFQAQTWGEHVGYRNCFWHSEHFLYTTCSPHVLQKEELLTKIYL